MSTATYPGLPSTFGATTIQANWLVVPSTDFVLVEWSDIQRIISPYQVLDPKTKKMKNSRFRNMPNWTQANQVDKNVKWYLRSDMSTIAFPARTILAIRTTEAWEEHKALFTSLEDSRTILLPTHYVEAKKWAFTSITTDSADKLSVVDYNDHTATIFRDPSNTDVVLTPTNKWEVEMELLALFYKPNAGAAPTFEPMIKAASGFHPLV